MTPNLCHLLAGLETGVFGSLLAVAWTVAGALWQGRPGWTYLVLLGSILDADLVWRRQFWLASLAGASLAVFAAGLLGAAFGLIVRRSGRPVRVLLLGLSFGALAFVSCNAALASRWELVGDALAHQRTTLAACMVFGASLSAYPRLLRSVSATFGADR